MNLVVNGEYNGLYLLTEKIEVHADRVDIDVPGGPLRNDLRGDYSVYSAEEKTAHIKNWPERRIQWLDGQWYNN